MRQVIVLCVGLFLIAVWGVGLRIAIHGHKAAREPDRIPLNSNASQLQKQNPAPRFIDDSKVVPVSYQVATDQKYPELLNVVDDFGGTQWIWPGSNLKGADAVVWLRDNKAIFELESIEIDRAVEVNLPKSDLGKGLVQPTISQGTTPLRLTFDFSKVASNDFRIQFFAKKFDNDAKYKLYVELYATGSDGFRIRKRSSKGPFAPSVLKTRISELYPWVQAPADNDIPVNILQDRTSTLGTLLRVYDKTDAVVGITLAVDSPTKSEVLDVVTVPTRNISSLQELAQRIDLRSLIGTQLINLHFAAVSDSSELQGHTFSTQNTKATPIGNNSSDGISTRIAEVGGRPAVNNEAYATKQFASPEIKVTTDDAIQDDTFACILFRGGQPISEPATIKAQSATFKNVNLLEGINSIEARLFAGDSLLETSKPTPATVDVVTNGFRVQNIGPDSFGSALRENTIQIEFSRPIHLKDAADFKKSLRVLFSESGQFGGGSKIEKIEVEPQLDASNTLITFAPSSPRPGYYQVTVVGTDLVDFYGNVLEGSDGTLRGNFVKVLGGPVQLAAEAYPVTAGVNRGNAPMVEFPEFVAPRKVPTGFNPNDKVETRVARLYFYRDAHRVAQILNRRVQSYNRQEVAARRQLADKSRQQADSTTTNRMSAERAAVQAAQRTRELENQLSDTQRALNSTIQQLQSAAAQPVAPEGEARKQQIVDQLQNTARSFAQQAETLESQVRTARDTEVATNERWQNAQREEELARTDQFRMETAAAHADPDTFAAGNPLSDDPVAQVSISVIGEGLLHLRGPLKGVNQVRMMVDQIDSPQGQVRINVHSTQINGDEADELEVVANRIQTYIDQSRFLTVQSAEMLRKAVIHVASLRAEQARGLYPGATQAERDQLYLNAFFGADFVNELRTMDSELLQTGNKLLSLHSMDVTSLSSALMLLALANNSTRLAILEEFQRLVQSDLTMAERQYIHSGIGACVGGCKKGCKHQHGPPICQLSGNSSFVSLRGFFDSQLQNDDTMSPLQREAIGLAQILKARLITEMEYKQRVMERAVIEDRTQAVENSEAQLVRERTAEEELRRARTAQVSARGIILPSISKSVAIIDEVQTVLQAADSAMEGIAKFLNENRVATVSSLDKRTALQATLREVYSRLNDTAAKRKEYQLNDFEAGPVLSRQVEFGTERTLVYLEDKIAHQDLTKQEKELGFDTNYFIYVNDMERDAILSQLNQLSAALARVKQVIATFHSPQSEVVTQLDNLIFGVNRLLHRGGAYPLVPYNGQQLYPIASVYEIKAALQLLLFLYNENEEFREKASRIRESREAFQIAFARFGNASSAASQLDVATEVFRAWTKFAGAAATLFDPQLTSTAKTATAEQLRKSTQALEDWLEAISKLEVAQSIAQDARRPLDHKKFLDMLIDEMEEKYIELLEGTRAHTANIDNYLKRLTTALDDDFNTQYYYPVFRLVREASQYKRVEFGQTETTNILVNNREFGKVSPSATMEFDLPKRDILIQEGLDSALAIYNDVGALVNDPNLLALAKMQSGGSVASPGAGTLGGMGAVRNVLPGLRSDTSEQLIAQNAGSGPQFESNVEKLIPDPAIYKFETGTGYEIRPVIAPDGQAVVFDFHYLYSTQVREPVRADEKHLGRVKQHFIDTDVQLSNFELREVSRYVVALKAERTANGVPLLEDIPVVGALWRPLPNREKSLQQNIIMAQATIFPTLFDLMGLRWAPAISDLDPLRLSNREFLVRGRHQFIANRIFDYAGSSVDDFLRVPEDLRRGDYYRSQESLPTVHPNGYRGPGLDYQNSQMREGYNPEEAHVHPGYVPSRSPEGALYMPHQQSNPYEQMPRGAMTMEAERTMELAPPINTAPSSRTPMSRALTPNRIPSPSQLDSSSSSRRSDGWQYQQAE